MRVIWSPELILSCNTYWFLIIIIYLFKLHTFYFIGKKYFILWSIKQAKKVIPRAAILVVPSARYQAAFHPEFSNFP